MRIFLDANVLFSAARNPDGNCAALIRLAVRRRCALLSSRFAIEEARRNLALKSPQALASWAQLLDRLQTTAEASATEYAVARKYGLPAKDTPILAAAIRARATILVTGDQTHFGSLFGIEIAGVTTLLPARALQRLMGL